MDPELTRNLEALRKKRGYLLPHHGLMAISMPRILDAYDTLYTELTLTDRVLTKHEHELVWMAILIVCEEALGTHHIRRYLDAGGSNRELAAVTALTAYVAGGDAHRFIDRHWRAHLPDLSPRAAYLESFAGIARPVPLELAHMAAAAICTCRGDWTLLAWHIEALYALGGREHGLAEALSLTMFPGSVPNFVEAAEVWRSVVLSGAVEASPAFAAWAQLSGQGGYDEATGAAPPAP